MHLLTVIRLFWPLSDLFDVIKSSFSINILKEKITRSFIFHYLISLYKSSLPKILAQIPLASDKCRVFKFFFIYIYYYGSTQTYTKLKIYNHQAPKYSNGTWEWKDNITKYFLKKCIYRYILLEYFVLNIYTKWMLLTKQGLLIDY